MLRRLLAPYRKSICWVVLLAALIWISALPDALPGAHVVNLISPIPGSTVFGTIPLSADVDRLGVLTEGVQFRLDDVSLGDEQTTRPYMVSWDTTRIKDGDHTLRVVVRNALGLRFISAPFTITVSNIPPPGTTPTNAVPPEAKIRSKFPEPSPLQT